MLFRSKAAARMPFSRRPTSPSSVADRGESALALRLLHGTVGVSVAPEGAAMETFSWGNKCSAVSVHGLTQVRLGLGVPGLNTQLGEDVSSHPEEAVSLGAVPLQQNVGAGSLGKEFPCANSAHPNRRFLPGCLDQLKMEYKQLQKDAVRRRNISKN